MRDLQALAVLQTTISKPLTTGDDYDQAEAEVQAETLIQEEMHAEGEERMASEIARSRPQADGQTVPNTTPPAVNSGPVDMPSGSSTPARRRSGPPGSIPNFPGAMTPREPQPFFPSPVTSPPHQRSPMSSPPQRALPNMRLPPQQFAFPSSAAAGPSSPWHQLAASSGAPTPSLESGPAGKSSPHLGYPFERLNIGGSWSGANLWGDSSEQSEVPSSSTSHDSDKYRQLAGQASAFGSGHENPTALTTSSSKPPLPAALAKRRGSLPKNVLGSLLSPASVPGPKAPSPLASSIASSPSPAAGLKPISASSLRPLIDKASALLLDLRPPSVFSASHLPSSLSIAVPSTLLRRPAFTLLKLAQMLDSSSGDAISSWNTKNDIVLIDADTSSLPGNGVLEGLAGKFEKAGYAGNLWFLRGGFGAAAAGGLATVEDGDGMEDVQQTANTGLKVGNLGKLAFQQESTGSNLQHKTRTPPADDPFGDVTSSSGTERPRLATRSSGLSAQSAASVSKQSETPFQKAPKMQPANPFFDNIRQNLELSHGGGHERIALGLAPEVAARADDLPPWLAQLALMSDAESAERLAEEFYRVELGEQKRLQAVMDWHSKSSSVVVMQVKPGQRDDANGDQMDDDYFPYSITAGVERGTKNRYKNIWPYDHSRVRLNTPSSDDGDYINASFVQPRGTARRYIATQGPLDTTYKDFWTLVWEQNVSIIVMLTKQFEGGLVKCGNYWRDEQYGPLLVKLDSQVGGEDKVPQQAGGFDFGFASKPAGTQSEENIVRTFSLSHEDRPDPPRKVVQVQCTSWPDFDVPATPEVLIKLIDDVDKASAVTCEVGDDLARIERPPVLVHCSAGIGRTGTYIIVDAIVDALRRERQQQLEADSRNASPVSSVLEENPLHAASLPILQTSAHTRVALRAVSVDSGDAHFSSGRGSPISTGAASGMESGDSGRSVSFLVPPKVRQADSASNEALPSAFAASPSPLSYLERSGRPTDPSAAPNTGEAGRAVPWLEAQAEKMDVDSEFDQTEDKKRKTMFDDLFTKHRGGSSARSADSSSTDLPLRRPSLGGTSAAWISSERVITGTAASVASSVGAPAPITKSNERHRTPSPVVDNGEGLGPIATVLEGMRTQRMSLVQSLRQYLFVHKAIIQSYVNMVDKDRQEGREISQKAAAPGPTFLADKVTRPSHTSSTDEEGHSKRRASPTELMPETPEREDLTGSSTSSLAKRPSFKKMRPAKDVDGMKSGTGDADATVGSRPRRLSKLNKDDRREH